MNASKISNSKHYLKVYSSFPEVIYFTHDSVNMGGEHGNLLQYSCLENPKDREAWRATIYGVAKSQTQLKQLNYTVYFI